MRREAVLAYLLYLPYCNASHRAVMLTARGLYHHGHIVSLVKGTRIPDDSCWVCMYVLLRHVLRFRVFVCATRLGRGYCGFAGFCLYGCHGYWMCFNMQRR